MKRIERKEEGKEMDVLARNIIANGMLSFKPSIRITTYENPSELIRAAINLYPKIVYYFHGCSISGVAPYYELRLQYARTDTKIGDLCVVSSEADCLRQICRSAGNFKPKLVVIVKKTVDLSRVTNEFQVRHAAFYSNLVSVSTAGYQTTGDYSVVEFGFTYRIAQSILNKMEEEVDAEVARISKLLFSPDMPVETKIFLAHNYLAVTVNYQNDRESSLAVSYTQSAYGALIRHRCVCQGFAEAFKRIMDYNGIGCDVVCGQIVGSSEYHAWNIVSLGKEDGYCHIDVTWDAAGDSPEYTYFCKGDRYFEGKRVWNREYNTPCSGRYAVLSVARKYILMNRDKFLAKGIDRKIIGC